jgi:hypothetical protein
VVHAPAKLIVIAGWGFSPGSEEDGIGPFGMCHQIAQKGLHDESLRRKLNVNVPTVTATNSGGPGHLIEGQSYRKARDGNTRRGRERVPGGKCAWPLTAAAQRQQVSGREHPGENRPPGTLVSIGFASGE